MAYEFKSASLKDIGLAPETIYTVPAGMDTLCMALNISNTTDAAIKVTVVLHDDSAAEDIILLDEVVIPVGSALPAFGRQKHILMESDYITIESDTADSADAILSFIEDINSI